MRHILLITLSAATLLAMTGCASEKAATTSSSAPAATAAPAISSNAQAALGKAQTAVKEAKAKYALWTTAENALNAAEEAAQKGDSEGVMKNAKTAEEQAHLGMEQAKLPPLELKNL